MIEKKRERNEWPIITPIRVLGMFKAQKHNAHFIQAMACFVKSNNTVYDRGERKIVAPQLGVVFPPKFIWLWLSCSLSKNCGRGWGWGCGS